MRLANVLALCLAVVIDGFFAFVNFYPVAPARVHGAPRRILCSLDPAQAKWLTENLLDEFNREHNVKVSLESVDEEHLLSTLSGPKNDFLLAAIPRARGKSAADEKLVRSFADSIPAGRLNDDFGALAPHILEAAKRQGQQYFLPAYSTLDIAVFRLSRVRDAVRHWSLLRTQIDAALKAVNGRGLPAGYELELEPEQWDAFDRFVIGYYWAHRRYGGQHARGRMVHRTGETLDGEADLIEGNYRAGANDTTIAQLGGQPQRDYFQWERLYRQHGLYADVMYRPEPVDDQAILEGLQKGELFFATVDQMQAFTLHGGSHPGTPPFVDDPDDLGFAPLSRISSAELDASGTKPARMGRPFSLRVDWVWALPVNSPDAKLAYELVAFLWERNNHYRACAALGMVPLRTDVTRERSSLFRLVWMDDVFDAVFAEWSHAVPLPRSVENGLGSIYAQLWEQIVGAPPSAHVDIAAQLAVTPSPRPNRPGKPVLLSVAAPPDEDDGDDDGSEAVVVPSNDNEGDDDAPAGVDHELWRGRVELEVTK